MHTCRSALSLLRFLPISPILLKQGMDAEGAARVVAAVAAARDMEALDAKSASYAV